MEAPAPSPPAPPDSPPKETSWPRRTAKACSNCRRDKVRCDGAKPCSGCTKKGLQCLDGCEACRKARARCEKEGDACKRCVAEGIECVEDVSLPPTVGSEPASLSERVKAACQSCRNDNKKCDDQRPCARCVSRSETCVPAVLSPREPGRPRCDECRKQNARCEEGRPCSTCVAANVDCNTTGVRQAVRTTGTRVKAACTSCRRNKVRCDGSRPCGPCGRRKSECRDQLCRNCAKDGAEVCNHRTRLAREPTTRPRAPAQPQASSSGTTLPPIQSVVSGPASGPQPPAGGYYILPWPVAPGSHPPPFPVPFGQPIAAPSDSRT